MSREGKFVLLFLNDTLSKLKGYVVLTSSSPKEAAQESDRIRGSYFTHYLVSGLRGAADFTSDNRVTLNHAYQYAYHQTLARTESTLAGPQHPSYNIQLTGSGELVVTDTRQASARLLLPKPLTGHFFIRDTKNKIVAEVDKLMNKEMAVGLEPGFYSIILIKDRKVAKAEVKIAENHTIVLAPHEFSPIESEKTTVRGTPFDGSDWEGENQQFTLVPAEFAVYPQVSTNLINPEETQNNLDLSLFYSRAAKKLPVQPLHF